MARILITGSSDGLGRMAAAFLIHQGHQVVLHARNKKEPRIRGNGCWIMKAIARKWPHVYANAVDPGWVPTKMGGPGAPDDLQQGFETQAWLAVSTDNRARVSGRYFYHSKEAHYHPQADNTALQDEFLAACEQITGVHFPVDPT